ncbi:M48 family metallopeptidase [Thermoproteota archaeon]
MRLLIASFLLSIFFSGCTEFNPVTQRQDLILYSTEREVSIGKNVARQVEKEYKLLKNPLVIDRVDKIAEKIAAVCDRRDVAYYVRVVQAKEREKELGADINAFALPGGYVYVFESLLEFVDSDDQLAAVIAHEIAHIVAKHSIKKLQASMGATLLTLATLATEDPNFVSGTNYALTNLMLAYSRQDELLADRLSIQYTREAGYDPRAMIDFLEKLREKHKKDPLRRRSVYRTHPYTAERIAEIKQQLGEPLTIADYVNRANE